MLGIRSKDPKHGQRKTDALSQMHQYNRISRRFFPRAFPLQASGNRVDLEIRNLVTSPGLPHRIFHNPNSQIRGFIPLQQWGGGAQEQSVQWDKQHLRLPIRVVGEAGTARLLALMETVTEICFVRKGVVGAPSVSICDVTCTVTDRRRSHRIGSNEVF